MDEVGLRELKQNPSAAIRAAAAGERVVVTDRGRPVAQLVPVSGSALADLRVAGLVRQPRRALSELPTPRAGLELSSSLAELRGGERY